MYQLVDVTKTYTKDNRAVAALAGVSLTIEDGEWLAVQGPTGHGKTTLLQMLGALDRPSSGTVRAGRCGTRHRRPPRSRRGWPRRPPSRASWSAGARWAVRAAGA